MNCQNGCSFNAGSCPAQANHCPNTAWYKKFIKPFFSFVISALLALSMSHLCEKYSTNNSFEMMKSDMDTLRNSLNLLMKDVRVLTESREEFKNKLLEVNCFMPKLTEAIYQLRNEVSDGIKNLIQTELQIYSADKTAKADYALEVSGGSVLTVRNTETYTAGESVLKLFGMPLCTQHNTPRAIIQAGALPGECWPFKGYRGIAIIQLFGFVDISGFTLEHISPMISPTGETSTAPRDFSMWGLNDVNDENGFLFGEYTYDNSGPPIQYFEVQHKSTKSYEIVALKIHSNSGNNNYTCIYRIRVHGILTSNVRGKS